MGDGPSSQAAAFASHQAWIRQLQQQQQASTIRRQPSSPHTSLEQAHRRDGGRGPFRSSPFDLAEGPIEGAYAPSFGHEVDEDGPHDRSVEDYDEQPVYRSLGLCLGFDDGADSEAQEVGHEPPVYRGLGGMVDEAFDSDDDADAAWQAAMPPLVQRQRAGTLELGPDFDGFN